MHDLARSYAFVNRKAHGIGHLVIVPDRVTRMGLSTVTRRAVGQVFRNVDGFVAEGTHWRIPMAITSMPDRRQATTAEPVRRVTAL
jgi:hypothetical protein